jgi:uncharacterized membrane protein HdeD (DUF308 family)
MLAVMARNWWIIAIRGVAAILFGIGAFLVPDITVVVLVAFFAAYAIIDGVSALVIGLRGGHRNWVHVTFGIVGILAGIVTFLYPLMTALLLLAFIGAWAIVTGALQIVAAIRLRREIENEWWLALSGLVSALFGGYILLFPGPGAIALIWVIGTFAILEGILLLMLALRLRGARHALAGPSPA